MQEAQRNRWCSWNLYISISQFVLSLIHISLFTWISFRTLPRRPATLPSIQVWLSWKSRAKSGGTSLEQLLWSTRRHSRKHWMVICSDSYFHQYFCRRLSVYSWMAACSVCDKESSYWSFRSPLTFYFEQDSFQCIHEFLSLAMRSQVKGRKPYMFNCMTLVDQFLGVLFHVPNAGKVENYCSSSLIPKCT